VIGLDGIKKNHGQVHVEDRRPEQHEILPHRDEAVKWLAALRMWK
jgi:hypothetical protein